MNTSEALDLSKENIQPLKQGRNAVKLGTALQAQNNAELHQQLMAEREQFELLIRMYEGDDPLQPHFEYVRWIEQSFPKHGPESNLVQILENTLSTFKDDLRYKQDLRYAELLIKYIDTQANPLEIYQIVYDQGLCTMCAPFYKAWADEYDKINDFKSADRIFELGIKVKAQPLDLLPEAQLRFQLSLGRRMLGYQEEDTEVDAERQRQVLHKLQRNNVFGERGAVGAPGCVKQKVLGSHNAKNNANAPFKIYQADDGTFEGHGDGQGKTFPKQGLVNKENSLKAGPWTQQGGKHRSHGPTSLSHGPAFQVHEDEDADLGNSHLKTPAVPRALKPRKIDNFTCPMAVFEPPDPTKKPMYCKNKVYAGGSEFQFEELRAALYNRRYEKLLAARRQQEEELMRRKAENEATFVKVAPEILISEDVSEKHLSDEVNIHNPQQTAKVEDSSLINHPESYEGKIASPSNIKVGVQEQLEVKNKPHFEEPHVDLMGFENKNMPHEGNTSAFHCQSFTVNTKEAMNVVQEMWQSPTPAPAFAKNKRASRPCPVSPANLEESRVFKVPIAPAPHIPASAPNKKSFPFPIFSDEEPSPACTPTPIKTFQVYSDEAENKPPKSEGKPTEMESGKTNSDVLLPFPIRQPSATSHKEPDVATMKMLAFQSDSDEEREIVPKPCLKKIEEKEMLPKPVPEVVTSAIECRKLVGPRFSAHPPIYDEDKFDDMTCNTKAFDFALPSSTPLVGHFQSKSDQHARNNCNGSYIVEDVKKSVTTRQDLSIVFEASKERYSSSSGSSGCKTQGSVCTVGSTSEVPPTQPPELLGKLAHTSANKSMEELHSSLGLLDISGQIDPFSPELITRLLTHIGYPKKHHLIGLHILDADCPPLHSNSTVTLGNTKYSVIGELGKGSYARVLKATRDSGPVALKQQRPAWEWEWYIVQEVQSRLPPNMMAGYLQMSAGYIYRNASILESEWAQYGSILSVVNKLKISGKGHDLQLAMLFSIQLVSIVEHLHKCQIIHGDIKPDNFVLFSLPSVDTSQPCLKLIDFGRSIDMTLFPEDITFTTVVKTDGFQCNEMKEGRPWTYQTDLYGLAGSIYCVLIHDYMKVVKRDNKWQLSSKIPRYMKPAIWTEVFTILLNVESCDNRPSLTSLRETLEQNYKETDPATVQASINKLTNVLLNK